MIRKKPRFVVCLAAFNGVQWLSEQVNSILTQSNVDVEIYISVDRSSDGTEELVSDILSQDSRVKALEFNRHFGGAALNFFQLMKEVDFDSFDYIAFSDQDDIWLPAKLERAHEVIQTKRAEAYSCNVIAFWPDGHRFLVNKSQPQKKWDFLFEAAGPGCTYVLTRKCAKKIQGLIKSSWEKVQLVGLHDWFFYACARSFNYTWVIDDFYGMFYRQHEKNQVGVNVGLRAFSYRLLKIFSGWGISQSKLISNLVSLSSNPFVLSWTSGSRIGMLKLAFYARQCRRRFKDQVLFFISCLLLTILGNRNQ